MTDQRPTVQVPGGQILAEVRDAYQAVYRDRIAEQDTRLVIVRFTPDSGAAADPSWAKRLRAAQISADQKTRVMAALVAQPDLLVLSDRAPAAELADVLGRANTDSRVAGVIVQTPLPARLAYLFDTIAPATDLDALGVDSPQPACATADGIHRVAAPFLDQQTTVAVVGTRGFVGSSVVALLRAAGHTPVELDVGDDLRQVRDADIVISTTGIAGLLTTDHIHGAHRLVVDSGFIPTPAGAVGDLTPEAAALPEVVTPVPGGLGPVEMAVLAERIVRARPAPGLNSWRYRGLGGAPGRLTSVNETFPAQPYNGRGNEPPVRRPRSLPPDGARRRRR